VAGVKRRVCLRDSSHTSSQTQPGDPALGHDWSGEWEQITAPTCTTAGRKRQACVRDPSHIDIQTGDPALDHNWGEWVQTTEPTFIAYGIKTRACLRDPSHKDSQTQRGDDPKPITSAADWATARSQISEKTGSYTLTISGDVAVDSAGPFGTTLSGSLSVTLKGSGKLSLTKTTGSLINIGSNQTLVIDSENLKLDGYLYQTSGSTINIDGSGRLELKNGTIYGNHQGVSVGNKGTFIMSGGKISCEKGGVYIPNTGTFTMSGGEISGGKGNGVYMPGSVQQGGGTFTMSGGKISSSTAASGGGVYVGAQATFTMNNGEISGNSVDTYNYSGYNSSSYGGGVYVDRDVTYNGTFTMNNGKISGNYVSASPSATTYNSQGGGVYVRGTFTMKDGEISGNDALEGGGVYAGGAFNMYGGKVSGNAGSANSSSYYGMGVYVNSSFVMYGGEISGNGFTNGFSQYYGTGGGVYVKNSTFRIVTGKIYNNFADTGRAIYGYSATMEYGVYSGTTWIRYDYIPLNYYTIEVLNGVLTAYYY